MFEWLKKILQDEDEFDHSIATFTAMLKDGLRVFELASGALLGESTADEVRQAVFDTDKKINAAEQVLRRELVVRLAVHGGPVFPTCLVLTSIAKDAERIGDYAKNLFDLAALRPFTNEPQRKEVAETRDAVARLLGQIISVYISQDEDAARTLLREADGLEDICDEKIESLLSAKSQDEAGLCVVTALSFRYLKRVTGHARNIVTSIVMPVDKLDFFDER